MGSATREALASSRAALAAQGSTADLATGESLLNAGRVIGDSSQLLSALVDPAADAAAKAALVRAVFASALTPTALELLQSVAATRWSSHSDLLAGVEDLGLRSIASSTDDGIVEAELFAFGSAVSSNAELELALASKLGKASAKVGLVNSLLGGKVTEQTLSIVRHLVQQPRGRRIGELLRYAASVVADQSGASIATITSAATLAPEQVERLRTSLTARYGRRLTLNQVVNPALVGGVHVQIGDDVIDGSIATRLKDLRSKLAG
ncbi:F0F1 ATP synthase subunit delta [Cryobacterium sp. TMT1-21]|uniref:ATP synthase subunit delta n=1 Tax=Cryobacterium shii TaxID=1259235 RepID=A0AAQ2C4D2_9MICO|nr:MULTISPECIES: F0F1 ATP synthase subunit delta [Cryobacterium]TFC42532.1 F0F1 ATP synthase subunit delta [Cryobacterium shii]TFD13209.1 F0F1 ATP synthase subunit delta [Cryobacterium sp. TMT1-21]TFD18630.1 F0F1 ATP synthase subunit delta [Cryobacterium sp. TMT4-10]TFD28430.1 F0F1 ATP synthase subunit delta [Cryobacterium sp. TMT2-23]TFD36646.1 F0F1 ATP synthase subunit delta [Cryobacterium sp. TMT2-10]